MTTIYDFNAFKNYCLLFWEPSVNLILEHSNGNCRCAFWSYSEFSFPTPDPKTHLWTKRFFPNRFSYANRRTLGFPLGFDHHHAFPLYEFCPPPDRHRKKLANHIANCVCNKYASLLSLMLTQMLQPFVSASTIIPLMGLLLCYNGYRDRERQKAERTVSMIGWRTPLTRIVGTEYLYPCFNRTGFQNSAPPSNRSPPPRSENLVMTAQQFPPSEVLLTLTYTYCSCFQKSVK